MAGSWSALTYRKGYLNSAYVPLHGLEIEGTADSSDGSFPVKTIEGVSGWLCGIDVVFGEGAEKPNAIQPAIQSIDEIQIAAAPAPLTASGRVVIEPPVPFAGGMKLAPTGNTTNGAKFKMIPLVSPK